MSLAHSVVLCFTAICQMGEGAILVACDQTSEQNSWKEDLFWSAASEGLLGDRKGRMGPSGWSHGGLEAPL